MFPLLITPNGQFDAAFLVDPVSAMDRERRESLTHFS